MSDDAWANMQHGDPITCLGCGVDTGACWPETPIPDRCGECPPWMCDDCGELCSTADPCSCVVMFKDMAFADIKADFATLGLGLSSPEGKWGT